MAHQVETMMYEGELPWHGLGTKIVEEDRYDILSCLDKSGLNWEAEKIPLMTQDKVETDESSEPIHQSVPAFGVRRSSDNRIIGVVGERYTILQNLDAFKWFQPFLDDKQASLHTAGSLAEGSRVWILAKLNRDPMTIVPGDEVDKFILLSHSHDGSLAVRVGFTPVRVVCANTLAISHSDKASKLIRIKHSANVERNLDNIREIMNLANEEFEATAEQYRLLARKSINQTDLAKYVKRVLKIEDEKELSTRTENIMEDIMTRATAGIGNRRVAGTLWGAYNGVTEWLSRERGNSRDTRLNSLWFGPSAQTNKEALQIALQMAC